MEFTIKNNVYRTCPLDAFNQLHIARRLTPCLGPLAGLASADIELIKDEKGKVIDFKGDLGEIMTPLSNALSSLKDEDVEYILNACLAVTERKQAGNTWARLRVGNATMFDGITLPVMLQIAYHVIAENLTDFFDDLPSLSGLEGFLKAKGLLG
ncbi:conserved hypothetical protein [uncultured delta proteobacterium]|uniref:Uncharacterized protein n=1 Tax=uncultured delta proteobacterium TaxID=34034 RepID=A0A212J8H8_9DELT|nr:conserved hypothetical protein [uncultured delta proteobacterium]